jgi:hypothetical protein
MNKIPVVINKIETGKVCLINKVTMIRRFNKIAARDKSSLFIANWSISEMPIKLRNDILGKTTNFHHSIIGFQEKFENINNINYFINYKKKIERKCSVRIKKLQYYKKSFFNKSNHFYFFTKGK